MRDTKNSTDGVLFCLKAVEVTSFFSFWLEDLSEQSLTTIGRFPGQWQDIRHNVHQEGHRAFLLLLAAELVPESCLRLHPIAKRVRIQSIDGGPYWGQSLLGHELLKALLAQRL